MIPFNLNYSLNFTPNSAMLVELDIVKQSFSVPSSTFIGLLVITFNFSRAGETKVLTSESQKLEKLC